jgi:hypothetical protein
MIFLGPAPRTAPLTAVRLLVYGRPSASLRFFGIDATALVAFLDVFGLASLFVRLTRFVSAGHGHSSVGSPAGSLNSRNAAHEGRFLRKCLIPPPASNHSRERLFARRMTCPNRTRPDQVSAQRARAGVTGHNVRYVLGLGLVAVIIAFVIGLCDLLSSMMPYWPPRMKATAFLLGITILLPACSQASTTPTRKRISRAPPLKPTSLIVGTRVHPFQRSRRRRKTNMPSSTMQPFARTKGYNVGTEPR